MRGIADANKRRAIFNHFRPNADILILQETHSSQEIENMWRNEWGGEILYSHGTTTSRGVAVLVNKSIYQKITNVYKDGEGRVLIFDILSDTTYITIAAIYAPNEDKPNFFTELRKVLKDKNENKIIVGDFNLTLDVDLDRLNTYHNNNNARDEVQNIMDEFCLNDVWRNQNNSRREYSWKKAGTTDKASRIDFALVSGGLDQMVKSPTYIPNIKSDHRALYMLVETNNNQRGTGFWKLNNNLLRDRNYLDTINTEIAKTLILTKEKTRKEAWETIKSRIKKASTSYARNKTSQEKLAISNLAEKVNEYEERLPLNREETQLYENTKVDFENLVMKRTQGVMFRSKIKWYEEGEKNTKYFFSLEKARYNAKTCHKILKDNGQEITDQQEILETQRQYYQELYKEDTGILFDLENTHGVSVPKDLQKQQQQQITKIELQQAIKDMNCNKTPGNDGLSADFYKVFWNQIGIYSTKW